MTTSTPARIFAWSASPLQIINRGIIFVTLSFNEGREKMGDPQEWARSLRKEVEAKQRSDKDAQRAVAMSRDIEAEKTPLLWDELCAAFQDTCKAYNEEFQPERTVSFLPMGRYRFMVRPDALPEIVQGQFDETIKRVTITTSSRFHMYDTKAILIGSGSVAFVSLETRRETTVAQIAQDSIREGLGTR